MKSMRRRLTLLLISALMLIIFSAAIQGYRSSMESSSQLFDQQINGILATVVGVYQAKGSAEIHDGKLNTPGFSVQIWQNNQLVLRSNKAPTEPISDFQEGFSDNNFSGRRWRVKAAQYSANNLWVMVAQPIQDRFSLAESMTISAMLPFIVSMPILAFVVFFSVSRGLKPLKGLSALLSNRKGKDLSEISIDHSPSELDPVLNTLNSMFHRLDAAFDRERQFASNAAHELRTPLSVLKINLHNLGKNIDSQQDEITNLQLDTDRMIHVVNQILLLSRTSPELFHSQLSNIDIHLVAQQVITDLYNKIEDKQQAISLHGDSIFLASTEFTLYTLLQNLVGNACKYSPEGAEIRLEVGKTNSGSARVVVEDSGPGIDESEYDNVMQRFYRDQQNNLYKSEGSGLGLAIVGQIAALHNATIKLSRSDLGGLAVTVEFPLEQGEGL